MIKKECSIRDKHIKDHTLKFISYCHVKGWTLSDLEYMIHKENMEYKTIEELYDEYDNERREK